MMDDYADDVVLMAKEEEHKKSIIDRLEGYLDNKNLILNAGKTKIIRFRKRGGRESKRSWRWKGKKIEKVREFNYLGYVMQKNDGQEAQIRKSLKRCSGNGTSMGDREKKIW